MAYDEKLVAEITKLVLEALGQAQQGHPATDLPLPEPDDGLSIVETGEAPVGAYPDEVVIGLAPAFGQTQRRTICGIPHGEVLREIAAGIEEEG